MQLPLPLQKTRRFLFAAVGILVGVSLLVTLLQNVFPAPELKPLTDRLSVDSEQSIPTWLSQTLLFVAAVLLGVIAYAKKNDAFKRHWAALAFIFLYISIDEGATLHEMIGEYVKGAIQELPGIFYFAWVLPFSILVAVFILAYVRFLYRLAPFECRGFILAGLLYVAGALGMEMIGGLLVSIEAPHVCYIFSTTIEEGLEMAGAALLIITVLRYMRDHDITPLVRVIERPNGK